MLQRERLLNYLDKEIVRREEELKSRIMHLQRNLADCAKRAKDHSITHTAGVVQGQGVLIDVLVHEICILRQTREQTRIAFD